MPTTLELLKDRRLRKLSREAQIFALRRNDPEFAKLSLTAQEEVLDRTAPPPTLEDRPPAPAAPPAPQEVSLLGETATAAGQSFDENILRPVEEITAEAQQMAGATVDFIQRASQEIGGAIQDRFEADQQLTPLEVVEKTIQQQGELAKIGAKGVASGLAGVTVGSAGGLLRGVGENLASDEPSFFLRALTAFPSSEDGKKIADVGISITKANESIQQFLAAPDDVAKDPFENPEVLADPRFWVNVGASGVGSMIPFMAGGLAAGALGVGGGGAAAFAGVTEGLVNGSLAYEEAREKGLDPAEAAKQAAQVGAATAATSAVAGRLGVFGEGGGALRRGVAGGVSEAVEEAGQEAVTDVIQGDPISPGGLLTAAIGGAVPGAGFGAVLGGGRQIQPTEQFADVPVQGTEGQPLGVPQSDLEALQRFDPDAIPPQPPPPVRPRLGDEPTPVEVLPETRELPRRPRLGEPVPPRDEGPIEPTARLKPRDQITQPPAQQEPQAEPQSRRDIQKKIEELAEERQALQDQINSLPRADRQGNAGGIIQNQINNIDRQVRELADQDNARQPEPATEFQPGDKLTREGRRIPAQPEIKLERDTKIPKREPGEIDSRDLKPDPREDIQPPTVPQPKIEDLPIRRLAKGARVILDSGETSATKRANLEKLAEKIFGGTRAEGKFTSEDTQDALEAAVNRMVVENVDLSRNVPTQERLENINEFLQENFPSTTKRGAGKAVLQQFSTPPTIALVAAEALNPQDSDVVLEPSAGTGSLIAPLPGRVKEIRVNEIDQRRRDLLEHVIPGVKQTKVDAEFLNTLLPDDVQPTAIIMNPPFSTTAGRLSKKRDTTFGHRHVLEAAKRLAPGGRLVAILGRGSHIGQTKGREFIQSMNKLGLVRANLPIAGKEYQKFGNTSFGTRLIVFDKNPEGQTLRATELGNRLFPAEEMSVSDLLRAVETIPSRSKIEKGATDADTRQATEDPNIDETRDSPRLAPRLDGRQPRTREGGDSGNDRGGLRREPGRDLRRRRDPGSTEDTEGTARPRIGEPTVRSGEPEPEQPTGSIQRDDRDDNVGPAVELENREFDTAAEEDAAGFVEYRPAVDGPAHPAKLVESEAMASTPGPPITYKPALPKSVIDEKRLSAAQLEAVARAGQRHSTVDKLGFRNGFMLGDGTGVGKGRQIAAVIWDNAIQGRRKALWVSISKDLINAAEGDFKGIGADEVAGKLKTVNEFKPKAKIDDTFGEGVVFSTYQSFKNRRLQLQEWLGKDGVIIFDEAHLAKNAVVGPMGKPAKQALAVQQIQQELPNARVMYASATGATEPRHMAYMQRLGLWNPLNTDAEAAQQGQSLAQRTDDKPFESFNELISVVGTKGLAAMELISRELKAAGAYLARSISFEGVAFTQKEHNLTEPQRQAYDTSVEAWQAVGERTLAAIQEGNGGRNAERFATTHYWAQHQRFFKSLLTAFKVPTLVQSVNEALAADQSVVISMLQTDESATTRAFEDAGPEGDIDVSPKDIIVQLVKNNFPTEQWVEKEVDSIDSDGRAVKKVVKEIMTDENGNPVHNKEALRIQKELLEDLDKKLQLPTAPLDQIIDHFGRDKVAEVTGRRDVIQRDVETGELVRVSRAPKGVPKSEVNNFERDQFQDGKKRIAVITAAGGAGFSFHADRDRKNQQRRKHVVFQLSWSADQQMQFMGRTHRTNQASAPIYELMFTDVGGEKRFASSVARRLQSLGALTQGSSQGGGTSNALLDFNLETRQGAEAATAFVNALERGPIPDTELKGVEILKAMGIAKLDPQSGRLNVKQPGGNNDEGGGITKLLNRVMQLKIDDQSAAFDFLVEDLFQDAVEKAKQRGELDVGAEAIQATEVRIAKRTKLTTHDTGIVERVEVDAIEKTRPVSWDRVEKLLKRGGGARILRHRNDGRLAFAMRRGNTTNPYSGEPEKQFQVIFPDETPNPQANIFRESEIRHYWKAPIREQKDALARLKEMHKEDLKMLDTGGDLSPDSKTRHLEFWRKKIADTEQKIEKIEQELTDAPDAIKKEWNEKRKLAPKETTQRLNLISGSILPVWRDIVRASSNNLKIRVARPKGKPAIIGLLVDTMEAAQIQAKLTGKVDLSPEAIAAAVLGGTNVELDGFIKLRRGRVGRETAIIVEGSTLAMGDLEALGVLSEVTGFTERHWIPNGDTQMEVLGRLLKRFPPLKPPEPAESIGLRRDEQGGVNIDTATMGLGRTMQDDIAPKAQEATSAIKEAKDTILRWIAPTSRDPSAQRTGEVLRENLARVQLKYDRAEAKLRTARNFFDGRSDEENAEFISKIESGEDQGDESLNNIATGLRNLLDERRDNVQRLGTGKLQQFHENYFPHIWLARRFKGTKEQQQNKLFGALFSRRPLEGGKSFLKRRTHPTFKDGLEAGLEPVTFNPVELTLLKIREMDRYVMGVQTLRDLKKRGLAVFVPAKGHGRTGWVKIDDPIGTVLGPGTIKVKEFYDARMMGQLNAFAKSFGFKVNRVTKLKGRQAGLAFEGNGQIVTRFATPWDVFAHEIGHQLDFTFNLADRFLGAAKLNETADEKLQRERMADEMRAIADLRFEGMEPTAAFKAYARQRSEKLAAMVQAYLYMPERMKKVAPTVWAEWHAVMEDNPKIGKLKNIERSLVLGESMAEFQLPGLEVKGHWWVPEPASVVLNNHLMRGLRDKSGIFRASLGLNNAMNMAQLGMSAFHLTNTMVDSISSKASTGVWRMSHGKIAGLKDVLVSPLGGLIHQFEGNKLLQEWYKPGSGGEEMALMIEAITMAGGRVRMDPGLRLDMKRQFVKAVKRGNIVGAALRLPAAFIEAASWPIMEFVVPRQKLGVFMEMARANAEVLGPSANRDQVRKAMQDAWDVVDDRLGEVVYDNLFWNRYAKDVAMVSARSVGWNWGTWRVILGGGKDLGDLGVDLIDAGARKTGLRDKPLRMKRNAKGEWEARNPELTFRAAYAITFPITTMALGAIIMKLMSGEWPETIEDYFFPKTGGLNDDGTPRRWSLPTYMKDFFHIKHDPLGTITNKTGPLLDLMTDMVSNRDFFGTEIVNEDEPFVQRMIERAKHVGGQGFTPFGIQSSQRAKDAGLPEIEQIAPFVGLLPATRAATSSPAELFLIEQSRVRNQGTRTKLQAERSKARRQIEGRLRAKRLGIPRQGPTAKELATEGVEAGILTRKDLKSAIRGSKINALQAMFKRAPLMTAVRAYELADNDERLLLRPLLIKKASTLEDRPRVEQDLVIPKLRKLLLEPLPGDPSFPQPQ